MINVKAKIRLLSGKGKRKTPFLSGYRPLFNFIENNLTSGKITLKDRSEFSPGEEGIVEISFLNKEMLGDDFEIGKKFIFYEGEEPLGEGEVLEVY